MQSNNPLFMINRRNLNAQRGIRIYIRRDEDYSVIYTAKPDTKNDKGKFTFELVAPVYTYRNSGIVKKLTKYRRTGMYTTTISGACLLLTNIRNEVLGCSPSKSCSGYTSGQYKVDVGDNKYSFKQIRNLFDSGSMTDSIVNFAKVHVTTEDQELLNQSTVLNEEIIGKSLTRAQLVQLGFIKNECSTDDQVEQAGQLVLSMILHNGMMQAGGIRKQHKISSPNRIKIVVEPVHTNPNGEFMTPEEALWAARQVFIELELNQIILNTI